MRIGSAFLKARDNKEDRIQKRRSDNMAAFNNYVKTQSELGVEASVQDLEQMKQNLAGGDFFYGRQLPSSNVIEETSGRLGAIKADKEAKAATTVLANRNASLANMKLGLEGFVGSNPDDTVWWDANKTKPQLASVINVYGEDQAKVYLGMLNQNAVAKYVSDYNLQSYKTYDGIEAATLAAPKSFQSSIRAYLKSNLNQWIDTEESKAKVGLNAAMPKIVNDAMNEGAAVSAAVASFREGMNSKVEFTTAMRSNVEALAKAAYQNRLKPRFRKAQAAATATSQATYANDARARELAVLQILADDDIADDGSEEVNALKKQLSATLQANAGIQLTTTEDETILALKARIAAMGPTAFEKIISAKLTEERASDFILSTGIDLSGTRWVDENGVPTAAFNQLTTSIISMIEPKAKRGIQAANDVDERAISVALYGGGQGGSGEQSEAIKKIINLPKDADRKGKMFIEVNRIREANNKLPFTSMALGGPPGSYSQEWVDIWEQMSDRIGLAQADLYKSTQTQAKADAKTLIEAAVTEASEFLSVLVDGDEETDEYKSFNYINGKFFIPTDKNQIQFLHDSVQSMLEEDGLSFSDAVDGPEARIRIDRLMKSMGIQPTAVGKVNFRQNLIRERLDGLVEPGSSALNWGNGFIEGGDIEWMKFSVDFEALAPDANAELLAQAQSNVDDTIVKWTNMQTLLAEGLEKTEVGEVLADPQTHAAQLVTLQATIQRKIDKLKNLKPMGDHSYWRRDPATGTFYVAPENQGRSEEFGHKLDTRYKRDGNGGFIIDVAATAALTTNPDFVPTRREGDPTALPPAQPNDPPRVVDPLYSPAIDYQREEIVESRNRRQPPTTVMKVKTAAGLHPSERQYVNQKFSELTPADKPIVSAVLRSPKMISYLNKTFNKGGEGMLSMTHNVADATLRSLFEDPMKFLIDLAGYDAGSNSISRRRNLSPRVTAAQTQAQILLEAIQAYNQDADDPGV